jgi:rod shape determining protein RodA
MEKVNWRNFDFWLMGAVAILVIFGIAMIRSSVADNIELLEANITQRQLIFSIAGFVACLLIAGIDYHLWESMSRTLYIIIFAMLGILYVVGTAFFGAARWFQTGLFDILIQPSEIAKIVIIMMLATFFARNLDKIRSLPWIARSLGLTMGLVLWILLQPNLSTSILILVIWFAMLWAAGLPVKYLVAGGATGVVALAISIPLLLNPEFVNEDTIIKPYQAQRVTNFLFPDEDARCGETYNVNQAQISIGSGGWFGKGYGHGTQVQLRFLKVRWSDFIFASLSEELGFAGAVGVMALLLLVVLRILRAARLSRDTFGALLCYGVAAWIAFQAVVNIGMNLTLLPVTGLPLPFLSYGGSAMLSMLVGIGLVQSVILRHKALEF